MSNSAQHGGQVRTLAGQRPAAVTGQWQPASARGGSAAAGQRRGGEYSGSPAAPQGGSAPARLTVSIGPGRYRGTDLT